jgi:hypothetical protein
MVKQEQPKGPVLKHEEVPRGTNDEQSGHPFQSAREKWCNAKYGGNQKIPYDLANFEDHSSFSHENIESFPISNLNCK